MSFEELLLEAGEFGIYQKLLCFIYLYITLTYVTMSYWGQIFILLIPDHICHSFTNLTSLTSQGACYTYENSTELLSKNSTNQIESNNTGVCSSWTYDYSVLFPTISSEHNWVCEDSWIPYFIHTMFWLGCMCGDLLMGFLSDKFGRKIILFCFTMFSGISNIVTLFMPNYVMFAIIRFLTGMFTQPLSTGSYMLVTEFTGIGQRTIVAVTWAIAWTITTIFFPWLAYAVFNWKHLLPIVAIPTVILLGTKRFLPESPGWLIATGQLEEAADQLHRLADINGKSLKKEYFLKKMKAYYSYDQKKSSYYETTLSIFKTPILRKRIIILEISWLLICLCYNGNLLQLSHLETNIYMIYTISGLLEIPVSAFCIVALDLLGRKWPNVISLYIGGIVGIIVGLLPPGLVLTETILAMIVRIAFTAGFVMTFQYSSELIPTEVRGRGLAIQRMFGDIGSCIGPTIVYLAEFHRMLPTAILGILAITTASLIISLPETANQPLPLTLEDGKNFGRNQKLIPCLNCKR